MAVYGIIDSQYVSVAANIDLSYLQREELRDGTTFAAVIPRISAAFAAYNGQLPTDLAEYMAPPTTRTNITGRAPGAFEINRRSESDPGRPQRGGKPFAHNLAIYSNDAALGWTEDGLRNMSADDLVSEIQELLNGFRLQQRRDILARIVDPVEVPVEDGIITASVSPGFAGSGTGANAFPAKFYPNLKPIAQPYSHYWACPPAQLAATLKAMRDQQKAWFPNGNYDFVGTVALCNAIAALGEAGGFVRAERAFIREANNQAVAQVDPNIYLGIFDGNVFVRRPINDFTDAIGWMFQPKGALNPLNPIVPRYDRLIGRGVQLRSREAFPLSQATVFETLGYNVNNRVGMSLLCMNNAGAYQVPQGYSALG